MRLLFILITIYTASVSAKLNLEAAIVQSAEERVATAKEIQTHLMISHQESKVSSKQNVQTEENHTTDVNEMKIESQIPDATLLADY